LQNYYWRARFTIALTIMLMVTYQTRRHQPQALERNRHRKLPY
jgi:hypothetical protein